MTAGDPGLPPLRGAAPDPVGTVANYVVYGLALAFLLYMSILAFTLKGQRHQEIAPILFCTLLIAIPVLWYAGNPRRPLLKRLLFLVVGILCISVIQYFIIRLVGIILSPSFNAPGFADRSLAHDPYFFTMCLMASTFIIGVPYALRQLVCLPFRIWQRRR